MPSRSATATIDASESHIRVTLDELDDASIVRGGQLDDDERGARDEAEESGFGGGTEPALDHPCGLGHNRGGDR
jgi:hypothetical protein